jgi:hypothetical protein
MRAYPLLASTIGEGAAVEFRAFVEQLEQLPNVDHILAGHEVNVNPKRMDLLCALSATLVYRAPQCSVAQLRNLVSFLVNSKVHEFSVMTMVDLLGNETLKTRLLGITECMRWVKENKKFLRIS